MPGRRPLEGGNRLRRTKIVCTLGPASREPRLIRELIAAGMDVARLNLSHSRRGGFLPLLEAVRAAELEAGRHVAVMLDTRGPEVRTGPVGAGPGGADPGGAGGRVTLREGALLTLTPEPVAGDERRLHVTYPRLAEVVAPGTVILLDDGNVTLEVTRAGGGDVHCRVRRGGTIIGGRKVSLPGIDLDLAPLTVDDVADIIAGARAGADFIALSFASGAADVMAARGILNEAGAATGVVAKLESRRGVENLDDILRASDAVMVARGDLGVEYPVEDVPLIQKRVIEQCNRAGRPVITATQMLESMVEHNRPTRAEASDVANAILDGSDAVMLSEETAIGRYPVEAVQVMARIAERAEAALDHEAIMAARARTARGTVTDAISYATCAAAAALGATAIITATRSGYTARMVSRFRPVAPIIAATTDVAVARQLTLAWGVRPLVAAPAPDTDATIEGAVAAALAAGVVAPGDLVAITAGVPVGVSGTTNLLKVQVVGAGRTGTAGA